MERIVSLLATPAGRRQTRRRTLSMAAAGVLALALVGILGPGTPGLKHLAPAAAAPAQAGPGQVAYEVIAGGTASITGLQLPLVGIAGNGIGRLTFADGAPAVSGPAEFSAEVDLGGAPVLIKNGKVAITTPNGEVLEAAFEGQGTTPDARGFSDVTASFHITKGTSRYKAGAGTLTGLTNLFKSSFVVFMKGAVEKAPESP